MQKLTILFLSILSCGVVEAQTIYSALHLNQEREYKTKKPKKIIENITFFNANGRESNKSIKTFDNAGMLLTEGRFDDTNGLKARFVYNNDTVNRIKLSRTYEKWTQFGYSKETAVYTYDKNLFLHGITEKDLNGNIIRQTNLICNDIGHPIELSLFDGNGNTYGKETATYFYNRNQYITCVTSKNSKVICSDTLKINFAEANKFPSNNEIYNINGDLLHWKRERPNDGETNFEGVYTYDKFGNCTEYKIFTVTIKENGKRKRENDRIGKNEYFY